jgi:hypothetical protein
MYLKQHLCLELRLRQRRRHADHRAPDDVGGCTLDRRVDRGPLGTPTQPRYL